METKKNKDGSYEVVLGKSSVRNKNGWVFEPQILHNQLIKFNERTRGYNLLFAELGFPQKRTGESRDMFLRRWFTINLDRVCACFVNFTLETYDPDNPRILATVRPTGPFGDVARQLLDINQPGIYFGARVMGDEFVAAGGSQYDINRFITFDLVSEQS